jgi:hypothetical protein
LLKIAEFAGRLDRIAREAGKRFGEAGQSLHSVQE